MELGTSLRVPLRILQFSATFVIVMLALTGAPQAASAFHCEFLEGCMVDAEACVEHLHEECGDGCGEIHCDLGGDWDCPPTLEVAMICTSGGAS